MCLFRVYELSRRSWWLFRHLSGRLSDGIAPATTGFSAFDRARRSTRAALPGIVVSPAGPLLSRKCLCALRCRARQRILRSGNSSLDCPDEDFSTERTGDAAHP